MQYSVTPLLCGIRQLDQGNMTYGKGYGHTIWLPIYALLVRGDGRNILIDTGLDEDEVFNPPGFTEETGLEALTITECLEAEGLKPEDIDTVILTHLHNDHCGNNALFTNAEFYVQKTELDFCNTPHPIDFRYDTCYIEDIDFHVLDGDDEPAPGIRTLLHPGHTPGCQTVVIPTAKGDVAMPGFCCNEKNFPEVGPVTCPGVHTDAIAAYDNAQKVKEIDATILPVHGLTLASMRF